MFFCAFVRYECKERVKVLSFPFHFDSIKQCGLQHLEYTQFNLAMKLFTRSISINKVQTKKRFLPRTGYRKANIAEKPDILDPVLCFVEG